MRILSLQITSWVGTCAITAQHYYGTITWKEGGEKQEWELKRPMTAKERREYNAEMIERGCLSLKAKRGQETGGFYSKEEVREFAVKAAEKKWPDRFFIILEREFWACSARPCLFAPTTFKQERDRLNELSKLLEQAERENAPNKRLNEIDDEYNAIVKRLGEL